jgi:hypothetical protein
MNTEVIKFPARTTFPDRKLADPWELFRANFTIYLEACEFSREAIEWICNDFEPRYRALRYVTPLVLDVPDGYREAAEKFKRQTLSHLENIVDLYLMQLGQLEIDLYLSKFGDADRGGG